ncbi:MAG: hypothetical protein N3E49_00625 [Bacteroidia bacterium]|nr:hypothetical protein [Bacteroidia bacterium]
MHTRLLLGIVAVGLAQNVGIGTSNPTHRLHLANLSSTDLGLLRVEALSTTHGSLGTFSSTGVLGHVAKTGNSADLLQGDLTFGPDKTDWRLTGNAGTAPSSNFLGTTDNQPLAFRTNNSERMRLLTDGRIWIGTTSDLTPSNNVLNVRSDDAASARAITARSDTIGLYGEATSDLGPGIAGVYSDLATGGIGFFARGNNLSSFPTNINPAGFVAQGTVWGIMGEARSTSISPRMGGYFTNTNATTYSRVAVRDGTNTYKIQGTGSVNTVIQDGQGGVRLMTAPEAPQFLFQDFGEGLLKEGKAFIPVEPLLLPHIVIEELQVWVTPLAPCKGLYALPTPEKGGFFVYERGGGKSDIPFVWGWGAPVKGWERFPRVSSPPKSQTPSQP